MQETAAAPAPHCANCSVAFAGPAPSFCPACGQETRIEPPTMGEFVQQFGGAYFSTEGALWRTLKLLVLKPGELTVQYLAGRRKHYVLPLRLYLTVSLVLFLVVRFSHTVAVVDGVDSDAVRAAERGPLPTLVLNAGPVNLGVRQSAFVCDGLPALLCEQIRVRAAPDARQFLAKVRQANERVVDNFGVVMGVLLPLFALCLKFVNVHQRYTAHLVFALHLHAFWSLVLTLMALAASAVPVVRWLGLAWMIVYTLLASRRVYAGDWAPRLLRAVALTAMYMTLLVLTVPLAWLLALLA
jgi:Protein of unknown function (DUF3667)